MRAWKARFEEKLNALAEAGKVYDIGGGAVRIDASRFRKGYVNVDVDASYKPDIVADVQALPFADGSIDAALCISLLEHVERPDLAVAELHRTLKPGGLIFVTVPFIWPYHAAPGHYQDYWRFSRDALNALFRRFSEVEIVPMGGYLSAFVNFVPSFLKLGRALRPIGFWFDEKLGLDRRSTAPAFFVFAKK